MKNTKIREYVLGLFKEQKSRPGHILFMRDLRYIIMAKQTEEENKIFIEELNKMIRDGVLSYERGFGGMDSLRLTQKGYNELYDCRKEYEIAISFMQMYKNKKLRNREILMSQTINIEFIPTLNPKEKDLFLQILETLLNKNFISFDNHTPSAKGFCLLEKGFRYLEKNEYDEFNKIFSKDEIE